MEHEHLTVVEHPLIEHKLALLRDRGTPKQQFRDLVEEITMLLAYEATRDLALEPVQVQTPLERMEARRLGGKKLVLVPILRAGLGMVDGMLRVIPSARVGHIGLEREHDTHEPVHYYFKIPANPGERDFLVLDPMLATGGSAAAAVASLKNRGVRRLRLVCIVAAPEGVRRMHDEHPDVPVVTAALDRQLDENAYILPGLGDAGDRLFGT